nr:hypothetical protein [Tanacetum cinerariifolium]
VNNINGESQLHAKMDGKKIVIFEASIRRDLLFRDEGEMANHTRIYVPPSHTQKIFRNMERVGKGFSRRDTPLFPTMMKPRKSRRQDNELPQTSVPTETVVDEAINEEIYNSLERETTTITSLDVEQDWGNISKTQSKATPNEPSSLGTSLGGGPRRQDTIGDTIAQTRSENVSNFFNDPPLSRVNTLGSEEDRLKLKQLMELCTKLSDRVLNLEKTNTAQAKEIANSKKKVKWLERTRKSRSHGLKRLYKVGLSTRVESSTNEESLDEDVFDVNDQDDTSMFDANKDLQGKEVIVEEVNAASITTATTTTTDTTPTISMDAITLAKALIEIKTSRPKAKGLVMQEPKVNLAWDDIQAKVDENYELEERLQAEEQEQLVDAEKGVNMFVDMDTELVESSKKAQAEIVQESSSKRAGDELEQESSKKLKIKDENEYAELKRYLEIVPDDEDKVTIDATSLSSKSPTIVDYKIYKEGRKSFF